METQSLADIECFVLDMDGTINLGDVPIEGAIDLVKTMRQMDILFYFFTNNSSRSPQAYVERLRHLGFGDVTRSDIMTSGDVMIEYLKENWLRPSVYLAGTPALEKQFEEADIELLGPDCVSADAAVLGFDTTLAYEKINTLCRLIANGTPFLATNMDRVCPLEGGRFLPDCGSMAAMITHATGIEPLFVGKPSKLTADYILRKTKTPPHKTAIVGDRIYTDIMTAVNGGLVGIAVLSGEISRKDIEESGVVPTFVLESVADILEALRCKAAHD